MNAEQTEPEAARAARGWVRERINQRVAPYLDQNRELMHAVANQVADA